MTSGLACQRYGSVYVLPRSKILRCNMLYLRIFTRDRYRPSYTETSRGWFSTVKVQLYEAMRKLLPGHNEGALLGCALLDQRKDVARRQCHILIDSTHPTYLCPLLLSLLSVLTFCNAFFAFRLYSSTSQRGYLRASQKVRL